VGSWIAPGLIAGAVVLATVGVRLALQFIVVVWSLRADAAGRRHALALLRLLRFSPIRDRSP
jgi:hypothetical protein